MFTEDVTMAVPHIQFFKTIIDLCKENRELLPRLPEAIECILDNGSAKLIQIYQFEEYRRGKEEEIMAKDKRLEEMAEYVKGIEENYQESERKLQDVERGLAKREADIAREEEEINKKAKQLEDSYQERERERQKAERDFAKREKDMARKEKEINKTAKQFEERSQKMQRELQEAKDEIAKREEEKKMKEKEIIETERQREKDFQRMQSELQKGKDEVAKREVREKEIMATEKKREEEISNLSDELKNARMMMDSYKSRLASLSERQVKKDQRRVENTLASNRQSDLEKDFSSFFDHDRLDACDKMLSIYHEEEETFTYIYYPRLACVILEVAYEQAKEARDACVDSLKELTQRMVDLAPQMGTYVIEKRESFRKNEYRGDPLPFKFKTFLMEDHPSTFPKDAVEGILLSLKETAECCNLDNLMEGLIDRIYMKWEKWCEEDKLCSFTPTHQLLNGLDDYVKACLRLSWRIVTQVPPMKLEYQTLKFNKIIHTNKGYYDGFKRRKKTVSPVQETQEESVACYLWPALRDGGGRVIKAGEVVCVIQEEDK